MNCCPICEADVDRCTCPPPLKRCNACFEDTADDADGDCVKCGLSRTNQATKAVYREAEGSIH